MSDPAYEDRSFSTLRANVVAVVLVAPVIVGALLLFVALHGMGALMQPLVDASLFVVAVLLIVGIVAHELLHVIAWHVAARPPKGSLRLGFMWRTLTPFAHCSVPMTVRSYLIGAAAPGVLLGVVPLATALVTGWGSWATFGALFTLAAGGDALIFWVIRGVAPDRMVLDHPTRAGCLILP